MNNKIQLHKTSCTTMVCCFFAEKGLPCSCVPVTPPHPLMITLFNAFMALQSHRQRLEGARESISYWYSAFHRNEIDITTSKYRYLENAFDSLSDDYYREAAMHYYDSFHESLAYRELLAEDVEKGESMFMTLGLENRMMELFFVQLFDFCFRNMKDESA